MTPTYIIYKITNTINTNIYIGQTRNRLSSRWSAHKSNAKRGCSSHLYRAMRKYGIQCFCIEEIADALRPEYLNNLEVILIDQYNSYGVGGYNCTAGGEAPTSKASPSAATRKKISASLMGNKIWLGKKHSLETKAKMSRAELGNKRSLHKKHTKETKMLISKNCGSSRGKVYTPFGVFTNMREVSKALGIPNQTVSYRCNNEKPGWEQWYCEFGERRFERMPTN